MFGKKATSEPTSLEIEEARLFSELKKWDVETEEYAKVLDRLSDLHEIKRRFENGSRRVSPDALVSAGASLGGILLIMNYERLHVISSKAIQLLIKPRV